MKAIVARQLGPPDVLRIEEVPMPVPGFGQVLVRVHAIGVNFADTERRRGIYDHPFLPWIPGTEASGVVESVGSERDEHLVGRRVAFWAPAARASGAYAQYAVAPSSMLFLLPDTIPFDIGAALPLQGLTAYGLTHLATTLRPNDWVLVHAAAGGVGQILVQLAQHAGAKVLGAVSNASKAEVVRALGATPILAGPALPAAVDGATSGAGVNVVFDSIGLTTQQQSLAILAPYGRLVHFGEASGAPESISPAVLYARSLSVAAFGLEVGETPAWATARTSLLSWVASGALRLSVSTTLPLARASEAHRRLETRQTVGKVILIPPPG